MFLRDWWYCAAESREVGRAPLGRVFLDEPVVLYRKEDGTPVALEDQCCHRRAPLHKGAIEGDAIRCGYHGFLYDADGACIWAPGQAKLPPEARLRSYPLCERHGWVWIWMGEAAEADAALVPDFHQNTDPEWKSVGGLLPLEANHMLLVDNLLDLSHLAFLHAATIGSPDDTDPELSWERGDDWVRGTRIVRDIAASPRMQKEGITFNVDQTKVMIFTPPANVVIHITSTESGFAPGGDGRLEQNSIIFDSITPETESSCHYFWANVRNHDLDDEEYTAFMQRLTGIAFDEDKVMLEAQQRNLDRYRDRQTVDIGGDNGALQARRLVEQLIEREAAGAS